MISVPGLDLSSKGSGQSWDGCANDARHPSWPACASIDGSGDLDDGQPQESDKILDELKKVEEERKRRTVIVTAVVAVVAAFLVVVTFWLREEIFGPPVDVDQGEAAVAALTNDPDCRLMIDRVTSLGQEIVASESRLRKDVKIVSGEPVSAEKWEKAIAEFRKNLDVERERTAVAVLRFENSRREVEAWFRYVDNELVTLNRIVEDGRKAAESDPVVEHGKKDSTKTPDQRLEATFLALHDAFQSFRVWHGQADTLHPCGAADEGEEGWVSGAAKTGQAK